MGISSLFWYGPPIEGGDVDQFESLRIIWVEYARIPYVVNPGLLKLSAKFFEMRKPFSQIAQLFVLTLKPLEFQAAVQQEMLGLILTILLDDRPDGRNTVEACDVSGELRRR